MNYITTRKSEAPSFGWFRKLFNLNKTLVVVFIVALVLGLVNLVGTNALATQGVVLDQIEKQREQVTKESQILNVEIGKAGNLSYIESTAIGYGFRRTSQSYIITGNEAVAAAMR